MIPPLARQSRLVRQSRLTQCLRSSSLSISLPRRSFSISNASFQDAGTEPLNNNAQVQTPRDGEPQDKPPKPVSRLAAIKNRRKPADASSQDSTKTKESRRTILGYPPDKPMRTRFAPSPTGSLHLGSLRTALVCNLAARASKDGQFILRIEDTDRRRLVEGAEERIYKDLEWAGLSWDEGPDKGGPYGPYRQSDRLSIYKEHAQILLDNGSAYRCFCSSEQLESQQRALAKAGESIAYPGTCRHIPREESDQRAAAGEKHAIRFNSRLFKPQKFKDAIYGPFQKNDKEYDFIIVKSDGYPVYHLAHVIDDHLMKITHVIRGEEWLISTPKHLAIYEAFGWEPPTFAHLGLLINNDGSKLSKRHKSVDLTTYQNQNVFPVAMQSWLANLGSSFSREHKPPRTLDDVAEALTFKFTRGGIKLNPEKLVNFQRKYEKLLFGNPPLSPHEEILLRDNIVTPLVKEVEAITANLSSPLIPAGENEQPWLHPLKLVPSMLAPQAENDSYILNIVSNDGMRHHPITRMACLMPYLFWRPSREHYRYCLHLNLLSDKPISRDVVDAVYEVAHEPGDWQTAIDRITMRVGDRDYHTLLRLIATGLIQPHGPASKLLLDALGQEEFRVRTSIVRGILDKIEQEKEEDHGKWLEKLKSQS